MRTVDKNSIPICNIMGVNLAAINMEWLLDFTRENISDLGGEYICVTNVHTTVTAYEDDEYKTIQNSSILSIPDGGPLSTVGRKRGYSSMKRTTGPSYMVEIFKLSTRNGWKHFFYGSKQETLDKLRSELEVNYPGIDIVGMYSPPFRQLTDDENVKVVDMINKTMPDFVWVGLGAPKQEIWMYNHKGVINGLMVGVGAGFDYLAGNIRRAPEWMQKMNLEWLFRLFQDPKRLFKRYFNTNIKFIWHAIIRGK